jgi:hypothetical protein
MTNAEPHHKLTPESKPVSSNAEPRNQVLPMNIFEAVKVVESYQKFSKFYNKSKLSYLKDFSVNFDEKIPSLINEEINLKNQSGLSLNCTNQLREWILALTEKQLWALTVLDAYGKPSSGILEGTCETCKFM